MQCFVFLLFCHLLHGRCAHEKLEVGTAASSIATVLFEVLHQPNSEVGPSSQLKAAHLLVEGLFTPYKTSSSASWAKATSDLFRVHLSPVPEIETALRGLDDASSV